MENKQNSIRVIVGSLNPVKINAAKVALARCFPGQDIQVVGQSVPSGVSDQPMTSAETLRGAQNRVRALEAQCQGDFYVAFEGGVDEFEFGVATFAYIVVSDGSNTTVGRTADLPLPRVFYRELVAGDELGDVLDRHFNTENVKQKGGAIALLTNHIESRESTYVQALTLAMAQFLNQTLFAK
ncbi:MAG: inosine/xanthosine triphosphatase [Idiomarinaceae bacterium HL-53]|nr:MAG: inosine/xanthosine triphosphatase [Idiomarinaceae bacterium HL-53]CUS48298.1 inosine/xanthosine triphosphatase [Idiomarinaceae bacterium HL-53]